MHKRIEKVAREIYLHLMNAEGNKTKRMPIYRMIVAAVKDEMYEAARSIEAVSDE